MKMSEPQSETSNPWNYYTADDTMGDVPPIKTTEQLQDLFERQREDASDQTEQAWDDAARLVEAHRIWQQKVALESHGKPRGMLARTFSLITAAFGGAIMPMPDVPAEATVMRVFSAIADSIFTVEYAATVVVFVVALALSIFADFRMLGGTDAE